MTTNHRSLQEIRHQGLRCSISLGLPGLSMLAPDGTPQGIDTDFARAVAVAVTGSLKGIEWLPTPPQERIATVAQNIADLGASNTSWTAERDLDVLFIGVLCHDGEGFLVPRAITGLEQLHDRPVSVQEGTTTPANLSRLAASRGIRLHPVLAATPDLALQGYLDGGCAAYVLDKSALAGIRAELPDSDRHRILPDAISYEPMAPFVAPGNLDLFRVARHVLFSLRNAEVAESQGHAATKQLLESTAQRALRWGLKSDWLSIVLNEIGHYGQIFARNLGDESPLGLTRDGANLGTRVGGGQFAAPDGL